MLIGDELLLLARHLAPCPDCGEVVIACANGVRLDRDPDPNGLWGLLKMGSGVWASSAPETEEGSRHNLHEHQLEGALG